MPLCFAVKNGSSAALRPGVHPDASVHDRDAHVVSWLHVGVLQSERVVEAHILCFQTNDTTVGHGIPRVGQKVHQYLLHHRCIRMKWPGVRRQASTNGNICGEQTLAEPYSLFRDGVR